MAKSFVSSHECSIYYFKRMCFPIVNCVVRNLYSLSDFFCNYSPCEELCDGDLCISLCLCQLLLYLNLIRSRWCVFFKIDITNDSRKLYIIYNTYTYIIYIQHIIHACVYLHKCIRNIPTSSV